MAENMKRRLSKWDVTELHVEAVVHDNALSAKVDDSCGAKVDDSCGDLTEVNSIKSNLLNVEGSEINQNAKQPGEERNDSIIHLNDIFEKTQYLEQVDLQGDCKDGFKEQDLEPASRDRTMVENAESQDKPRKAAYDMSLGLEGRRLRNPNSSPIDDQSRSYR